MAALGNFSTFTVFPTGLPPYVNVSISSNFRFVVIIPHVLPSLSQFDTPIPGDGLWNVTIWDAMDTTAGPLCYVYA